LIGIIVAYRTKGIVVV